MCVIVSKHRCKYGIRKGARMLLECWAGRRHWGTRDWCTGSCLWRNATARACSDRASEAWPVLSRFSDSKGPSSESRNVPFRCADSCIWEIVVAPLDHTCNGPFQCQDCLEYLPSTATFERFSWRCDLQCNFWCGSWTAIPVQETRQNSAWPRPLRFSVFREAYKNVDTSWDGFSCLVWNLSRRPLVHFLTRTARSVMAMKFVNALNMLVADLPRPTVLKAAALLVPNSWTDLEGVSSRKWNKPRPRSCMPWPGSAARYVARLILKPLAFSIWTSMWRHLGLVYFEMPFASFCNKNWVPIWQRWSETQRERERKKEVRKEERKKQRKRDSILIRRCVMNMMMHARLLVLSGSYP